MGDDETEVAAVRLFSLPHLVTWVLGLVGLLLMPSANVLTSYVDPKLDYGEFLVNLPQQTLVVAKNSGTSTVTILKRKIEMQALRPLYEPSGFEPVSRGSVPPGSYAVIIASRPAAEQKVSVNDLESSVNTLSIMTPNDQFRFYFSVGVVVVMAMGLTLLLGQWSFEDEETHKPLDEHASAS